MTDDKESAWAFFDPKGVGKLSLADLKKKLSVLYPSITSKDLKAICKSKGELTKHDFMALLTEPLPQGFDSISESFDLIKVDGDRPSVSLEKLSLVYSSLGYGELTAEDIKTVLEAIDLDRDGKIGFEDYRAVLTKGDLNASMLSHT